jgi:hypothetical protein
MDIHTHDEPIVEDEKLTNVRMKLEEMENVWINTPQGSIYLRTNPDGVPQITMFMPDDVKVTRRIDKNRKWEDKTWKEEGQVINLDGRKLL